MLNRLLALSKDNWRRRSELVIHPGIKILLIIAAVLILIMAVESRFDRHPDELHHFRAANYYTAHFVPPEIGNPEVRDSYSVWGVSYLNYQWIEYFLTGKFMLVILPVVKDQIIAARLFNASLFIGLALFLMVRARKRTEGPLLASFLLISPQIWYVFSYVNNDAFALFTSMLLAYQIAAPDSLTKRFLADKNINWAGGIWLGSLIGVLLICKTNYWSFLVFAAIWLVVVFPFNRITIKRYAFAGLIAVSILAFRIGLDLYSNGETNFVGSTYLTYIAGNFEKSQNRLAAYQEEIAETPFKPSTIENDLEHSYFGLKLRAKGVSFLQMFTQMRWLQISFESFTGVYGYMDTASPKVYSRSMAVIYLAFGLFMVASIILSRDKTRGVQLAILAFGCLLTVFVSAFLSWNYAFQPQGRYLFPIIPMLGIFVCSNRKHLNGLAFHVFLMVAFLLSVYSFVFVGLANINAPV